MPFLLLLFSTLHHFYWSANIKAVRASWPYKIKSDLHLNTYKIVKHLAFNQPSYHVLAKYGHMQVYCVIMPWSYCFELKHTSRPKIKFLHMYAFVSSVHLFAQTVLVVGATNWFMYCKKWYTYSLLAVLSTCIHFNICFYLCYSLREKKETAQSLFFVVFICTSSTISSLYWLELRINIFVREFYEKDQSVHFMFSATWSILFLDSLYWICVFSCYSQ